MGLESSGRRVARGDEMRCGELVVALFTGCVIGWWWSDRPDFASTTDLFQVLTALGTLGAVGAALHSTRKADRRAEQERMDMQAEKLVKAKLSAALVRRHIAYCSREFKGLAYKFRLAGEGHRDVVSLSGASHLIRHELDQLEKLDLPLLAPLSPAMAANIALGIADIESVLRKIADNADLFDAIPSDPATELFFRVATRTDKAADRLYGAAQWYFSNA